MSRMLLVRTIFSKKIATKTYKSCTLNLGDYVDILTFELTDEWFLILNFLCTTQYSWNTAKVGVKHQSINFLLYITTVEFLELDSIKIRM